MTHELTGPSREGLQRLRAVLGALEGAVIAFSGGVDSSLLLRVAGEVLGDRVIAFLAVSESLPPEEAALARGYAARLGVRLVERDPGEIDEPTYAANEGNRCYACKRSLLGMAGRIAREEGLPWVLEGTLLDELAGHRPGMRAVVELGVRQPLVEAGLTKAVVRDLARHLDVPHWDKPSFACLGSRFPVGVTIDRERLGRVSRVESALRSLGFRQFRARYHLLEGVPLLRLELDPSDLPRLVAGGIREAVLAAARAEGFAWITADLEGYQTGRVSRRPTPAPQDVETGS